MAFIELISNISVMSIILFIIGISLIIVELYTPGFGAPGVSGLLCLIICIFVTVETIPQALILTGIFLVILVALFVIFYVLLSKNKMPRNLILETSEEGFSGTEDMQYLLGKVGTVVSICRPAGNVDFDGVKLDVVSLGEFIETGATVEVIQIEGSRIVVKQVNKDVK